MAWKSGPQLPQSKRVFDMFYFKVDRNNPLEIFLFQRVVGRAGMTGSEFSPLLSD